MRSELAELKKRPPKGALLFTNMPGGPGGFEVGAGWSAEHIRKLTERVAKELTEEAAERLQKKQYEQKDE